MVVIWSFNIEKKSIKILKKPAGSIRFYKQKTKKTEPNRKKTGKKQAKPEKLSQNGKNRAKIEQNRFEPVFP
jgi:hypothetical protein